jgi:guanylate kinase
VDGKDYFFLTKEQFDSYVTQGRFLEHAVVHGCQYGTLRDVVEGSLSSGKSVLMDIDVQGAEQVRGQVRGAQGGSLMKNAFVDIFIAVPSLDILKERLKGRSEDSPETMALRLKNAEEEIRNAGHYTHVVVNDDLETAYSRLKEIVYSEMGKS